MTAEHLEPDKTMLIHYDFSVKSLSIFLGVLKYLCKKDPYCSRKAKPFLRSLASSTSLESEDVELREIEKMQLLKTEMKT